MPATVMAAAAALCGTLVCRDDCTKMFRQSGIFAQHTAHPHTPISDLRKTKTAHRSRSIRRARSLAAIQRRRCSRRLGRETS